MVIFRASFELAHEKCGKEFKEGHNMIFKEKVFEKKKRRTPVNNKKKHEENEREG